MIVSAIQSGPELLDEHGVANHDTWGAEQGRSWGQTAIVTAARRSMNALEIVMHRE